MSAQQHHNRIVIIGASHAGISCAEKLRQFGYTGEIELIDRLAGFPIQRPPLSKAYLGHNQQDGDDAFFHRQQHWFEQASLNLHTAAEVTDIDPAAHLVHMDDGSQLAYDKCIIATGADARRLDDEVHQLDGVMVLRDISDAQQLRDRLAEQDISSAVIIGGGYIGLETAASLRKLGINTHVIEMADRILARVASPACSAYCTELHLSHGADIRTSTAVTSITGSEGRLDAVHLSDGSVLHPQIAIIGIGVVPAIELAEKAQLDTGNGIHVSSDYLSSDADIYAIGDVAFAAEHAPIRVESVHHAQFSAMRAAAHITATSAAAAEAWWFWSDQYEVKFQMAGLVPAPAADVRTVMRAGRKENSQSFWSFKAGQLVSVEAANDPQAYMIGKSCLEKQIEVEADWIEDSEFVLKSLLQR